VATISNNVKLWQQEAEEQAKKYSDEIKNSNQYLIDQLNQQKQNTLEQLQAQENNAIYNLNSNKSNINQTAEDSARQANINRLLSLKSNEQALNRAGLGTQGIVGSQNAAINNSYGENLTSILNQKTSDLRELEKEKNDTLLKYNENRLNLSNEYDSNLANLQASIDDKALSQYNTVYNNYLAMKQQEYENEQNRLAAEEAIRQYNEQMEYKKQQDAIANAQMWAQINAQKNSYDFDDENNGSDNKTTQVTMPDGYYSSKADIAKALGLSVAGDFESYIDNDYIDEVVINGQTYYKKGSKTPSSNSNNKNSSSTKKQNTSLLDRLLNARNGGMF